MNSTGAGVACLGRHGNQLQGIQDTGLTVSGDEHVCGVNQGVPIVIEGQADRRRDRP